VVRAVRPDVFIPKAADVRADGPDHPVVGPPVDFRRC